MLRKMLLIFLFVIPQFTHADDQSENLHHCDRSPTSTGMGLFAVGNLLGWCDAPPNGNYPHACEDYECCRNVATAWCQNIRPGCQEGWVEGGGAGAPGTLYCR